MSSWKLECKLPELTICKRLQIAGAYSFLKRTENDSASSVFNFLLLLSFARTQMRTSVDRKILFRCTEEETPVSWEKKVQLSPDICGPYIICRFSYSLSTKTHRLYFFGFILMYFCFKMAIVFLYCDTSLFVVLIELTYIKFRVSPVLTWKLPSSLFYNVQEQFSIWRFLILSSFLNAQIQFY